MYLIVKQSLMITYLLSIVQIRAGIPTTARNIEKYPERKFLNSQLPHKIFCKDNFPFSQYIYHGRGAGTHI